MKIRTQIALALLLLAIVPMAAIVIVDHASALRMVRDAVEAEAAGLTADMETRLGAVQGDIRRRVERIGTLPVGRWAFEDESEADREALYTSLMTELGETAPLVESFEFVPEFPSPSADRAQPPQADRPRRGPAPPAPVVIDMRGMLATVEAAIENLDPESLPEGADKLALIEHARRGFQQVRSRVAETTATGAPAVEIEGEPLEVHEHLVASMDEETAAAVAALPEQIFLEATAVAAASFDEHNQETNVRFVFTEDLEVPIVEDGTVVGELRARLENEELLRRVLGETDRRRGEIPFALDEDGQLLALQDQDFEQLAAIGISEPITEEELAECPVLEGWVIVTRQDEASGLIFGIARPIGERVREMRATAMRNFAFGSGLIGLALLGVLPLSRRMTRGLNQMTASAERLAAGDLQTRVDLRSKGEVGQLAQAFNNMARDLEANQQKLVEGELLRVEFDRKTAELEEARRFQLSLLPRRLPKHPAFDLAATMKTATEVGGDYYDFRTADEETLTVAIGDATGHGARAGTMVTAVKTLFSAFPPAGSLAEFQKSAAAGIRHMELGRMSMALTLARLTPSKLTLSAAGMPPTLLYRAHHDTVEEVTLEGMPLGGLEFDYKEVSIDIGSGDLLLFMSDGFPELPNPEGDTLGYELAREHFAAAATLEPEQVIASLLQAADSWTGGAGPADDITFVVIRIR